MNATGTLARVYQVLKARLMAGEFAPGERIDPAKLGPELAASVTPIRDALHRLAGERLVESWSNEGFRQPIVTEAMLRDLYGWSADLVLFALRAGQGRHHVPPQMQLHAELEWPVAAAAAFMWLADLSTNLEHRAAIQSLNDRSYAVRLVEAGLLADPATVLRELTGAVTDERWADARRAAARYHAERLRLVPAIAARFRPREASLES